MKNDEKIKNEVNNISNNQQSFKNMGEKSAFTKKDLQIKSIIFVAIASIFLIGISVFYIILSAQQKKPDENKYIEINTSSGTHNIQISKVLTDAEIITTFSVMDNRNYVELSSSSLDVFSFADGTIDSIENLQDYTVITIEHVEGFCSIYTFVQPLNGLEVNTTVNYGDVIASMIQSNQTVLRFQLTLDGRYVDPTPYL